MVIKMKKIIISIIVVGLLSTSSLVSINALEIECGISEELEFTKKSGNEPFEGYTLFTPTIGFPQANTYLINNDGKVVHKWSSSLIYQPALSVYLLENGNLLRTHTIWNPFFNEAGKTGRVEMFNWNGTRIWNFKYSNRKHCLHHDIEPLPLPNGNILMVAWEKKTRKEALAAGRVPGSVFTEMWADHIIEVEPIGSSGANIVWEWHAWDHTIQDYDSSKDNYGAVEDHPELIDINLPSSFLVWNYINSIDYNEELDQILLSSRNANEIWVIDHSTTTEEAAGHTGGNSGKGGDLLYRWGNPLNYHTGDENDQKLFWQHDARWIEPGCPGEGHITIFNNRKRGPDVRYSSVEEIIPPVDEYGNYSLVPGSTYGPEDPVWNYTADPPTSFSASVMSGAQRLPNGNTLICYNGVYDTVFFEVTSEKETVWEYQNPYGSCVYKINRYPLDYLGIGDLSTNIESGTLQSENSATEGSHSSQTQGQSTPSGSPTNN